MSEKPSLGNGVRYSLLTIMVVATITVLFLLYNKDAQKQRYCVLDCDKEGYNFSHLGIGGWTPSCWCLNQTTKVDVWNPQRG